MKADGKVFLSKLTQFNASKEGIDDSMIQLLYKIVETISSCVDGKQHISKPLTDDLLFEIDQSQFMYYRSIRCLKCKVTIITCNRKRKITDSHENCDSS